MNESLRTPFLTYYIRSLGERTRAEKRGTKFGFDWVIYNLALAERWIPHRLPFLRTGAGDTSVTKTEPEFGIDLAFLSEDRETLRVFVLKDEVLNNANWGKQGFDIDLRNAAAPDLTARELGHVKKVEVILAYNKDDDRTGIELYDRLVGALGTHVGDTAILRFDRWNLTTIVDKVQSRLLTPSLLPQKFFSHFAYICAQFADFRHGSDEWVNQMVPNWRRFLKDLLAESTDERCVRLLPVALLILQEHGKENPTTETGWLDLIEWGMLAAWNVTKASPTKRIRDAVIQMWVELYLAELERYYDAHSGHLSVFLSVDRVLSGSLADTVASAVIAHWHLGRLGILGVAYGECLPKETPEERDEREGALSTVSNWLVGFLSGNPSSMRPVIDLHHIELFLTWCTLAQAGRGNDVDRWLQMLANRLFMRRSGNAQIPFVEGTNSLERVFESVATGEKPHEFCGGSSVYLMCLMELICSLPQGRRDRLLEVVYRRLVLGRADCGAQMDGCAAIDLMLWIPPGDWGDRILTETLADEGECVTIRFDRPGEPEPSTGEDIADALLGFVNETRRKRAFAYPEGLPLSVVVLACLKHRSPLPPELWRRSVFGVPEGATDVEGA